MTLPEVLSFTNEADQLRLTLAVPAGLGAFAGHFPDQPILPGVVQIDWAIRLAALHLDVAPPIARDFQVKFRRVIQPEAALSLTLRYDRAKGTLFFEYRVGEEIASSGRIKVGTAAP